MQLRMFAHAGLYTRDAPEHLASLQDLVRPDSPAHLDCPATSRDLYWSKFLTVKIQLPHIAELTLFLFCCRIRVTSGSKQFIPKQ